MTYEDFTFEKENEIMHNFLNSANYENLIDKVAKSPEYKKRQKKIKSIRRKRKIQNVFHFVRQNLYNLINTLLAAAALVVGIISLLK